VTVEIEQEGYFMSFLYTCNKRFHSLYFWEVLDVAAMEVAVEILAQHSRPVVAEKHPIRVDHWYNEEIVVVSQGRNR
jgi:hypothetical protein